MYKRIFYPLFILVTAICVAVGCFTFSGNFRKDGINDCTTKNELTRITGWKFSYQIESECNFPSTTDVSMALQLFYVYWEEWFGDPADAVFNNLNNIMIEWKPHSLPFKNGYRVDGTLVVEGKAVGLTLDKGHIVVKIESGQNIYDTSLVHELIHASIRAANPGGQGDPDHEGDQYQGWTPEHTLFIKEINAILRLMDLNYAEENKKGYDFPQAR